MDSWGSHTTPSHTLRQGFPLVYTPHSVTSANTSSLDFRFSPFPYEGPFYRRTPVPLQACRQLAGPGMAIANSSMKAIKTGIQTLDI